MADPNEVPKETVDKVRAVLAKQREAQVAPVTPNTTVEAPVVPAVDPNKDRPRNEKGQFEPEKPVEPAKPELSAEARGLLAGLKAEREKRKALEAEVKALKERKPETPPVPKARDTLMPNAPADTQKFWNEIGDPVVREAAREEFDRIRDTDPVYRDYRESKAREVQAQALAQEAIEFAEDMALEGHAVDPAALLDKITKFEAQYDISLGSTNRKKFENAVGMLGGAAKAPAETQEQAKVREAKAAAEKARAGGVAPGSTATIPPPNERKALQETTRAAAMKGDDRTIAEILRSRLPKDLVSRGLRPY